MYDAREKKRGENRFLHHKLNFERKELIHIKTRIKQHVIAVGEPDENWFEVILNSFKENLVSHYNDISFIMLCYSSEQKKLEETKEKHQNNLCRESLIVDVFVCPFESDYFREQ